MSGIEKRLKCELVSNFKERRLTAIRSITQADHPHLPLQVPRATAYCARN